MQNRERENVVLQKASKCLYCGSTVDIYLTDLLYELTDITSGVSIVNYINAMLLLPSKSAIDGGQFRKNDSRCNSEENPLAVKEMRMFKWPIMKYNPSSTRVRYVTKKKYKGTTYLEDAILSCDCGRTLSLHPSLYSARSYSDRIGYNKALTKIRHYIVNHINRRP